MRTTQEISDENLREASKPILARIRYDRDRVDSKLARALDYLAESLTSQDLSAASMFKATGLMGNSIKMRFRKSLQATPRAYIERSKLALAIALFLLVPKVPLGKIGSAIGYSSERAFFLAFKRRYSFTPSDAKGLLLKNILGLGQLEPVLEGHELALLPRTADGDVSASSELACERAPKGHPTRGLEDVFIREVLIEALKGAGPEEQLRILNAGFEFRTVAGFEFLIRISREGCRDNRKLGVQIAELAIFALEAARFNMPNEDFRNRKIEGLLALGNARRLAADLTGADRDLALAEIEMNSWPTSTTLQAAFLTNCGYLRTFQRRFMEALELLDRACSLRRGLADPVPLAQTLMTRGITLEFSGDIDNAIADHREAMAIIEGLTESNPYLRLAARTQLANALCLFGDFEEAQSCIMTAIQLNRVVASKDAENRLAWLTALVAAGQGNFSDAERFFLAAQDGLLEVGQLVNVALVKLDLALLLEDRKLSEKARCLAVEALPILESIDLDREAATAFSLLVKSVEAETLGLQPLLRLRRLLAAQLDAPRR